MTAERNGKRPARKSHTASFKRAPARTRGTQKSIDRSAFRLSPEDEEEIHRLLGKVPHEPVEAPPAMRRPLSAARAPAQARVFAPEAEGLETILSGLDLEPPDSLTHGFHTYPARLHPLVVRRLLERYLKPGEKVLDPFVGSGTTAVEALVRGSFCVGTDINPIALRIAKVRTMRPSEQSIETFVSLTSSIAEASFADARKRVSRPWTRIAREQSEWYAPHVLQELLALQEGIQTIADPALKEAARLVFSSLLIKVSYQRSDTSQARLERQIGRGSTSRLFGRKAAELGERWRELTARAPAEAPDPRLLLADARQLPGPSSSVDMVITSPPYQGLYDYALNQERRFAWLEEDPSFSRQHEIGGRQRAEQSFEEQQRAVLTELRRVIRPGGRLFFIVGDGLERGRIVAADEGWTRLGEMQGFRTLGVASQAVAPPEGSSSRMFEDARREHLLYLERR